MKRRSLIQNLAGTILGGLGALFAGHRITEARPSLGADSPAASPEPRPGNQVWHYAPSGAVEDLSVVPVVGPSGAPNRVFVGFGFGPAIWWASGYEKLVALDPGTAFGLGLQRRVDPALGTPLTAPPTPGTIVAINAPGEKTHGCWAIVTLPRNEDADDIRRGRVLAAHADSERGSRIILADLRDLR